MNKGHWEAWVDNMPFPGSKRPTLHVSGEITVGDRAKRSLVKSHIIPINKKICMLEVQPPDSEGNVPCNLKYEEVINDSDTYSHVQILLSEGSEVTVEFKQISLKEQQQPEVEEETNK